VFYEPISRVQYVCKCTYEYSRSLNGFQIVFRLFRNQNYANLIIIGRRGYYIIIVYTGSGVIVPGADDGCLQFPKTIYCTRKLLQVTHVTTYLPISTVWCTLDVIRVCTRTSYYYNYDVLTQHDTFVQCLWYVLLLYIYGCTKTFWQLFRIRRYLPVWL